MCVNILIPDFHTQKPDNWRISYEKGDGDGNPF